MVKLFGTVLGFRSLGFRGLGVQGLGVFRVWGCGLVGVRVLLQVFIRMKPYNTVASHGKTVQQPKRRPGEDWLDMDEAESTRWLLAAVSVGFKGL